MAAGNIESEKLLEISQANQQNINMHRLAEIKLNISRNVFQVSSSSQSFHIRDIFLGVLECFQRYFLWPIFKSKRIDYFSTFNLMIYRMIDLLSALQSLMNCDDYVTK